MPQEQHLWIIVMHIRHFVSQIILYLGTLLQCDTACTKIFLLGSPFKFIYFFSGGVGQFGNIYVFDRCSL
jgi:hypothetical protein